MEVSTNSNSRIDEIREIDNLADVPTDNLADVTLLKNTILEENYVLGSGNSEAEASLSKVLSRLGYQADTLSSSVLSFKRDNGLQNGAEIDPETLDALVGKLSAQDLVSDVSMRSDEGIKSEVEQVQASIGASAEQPRDEALEELSDTVNVDLPEGLRSSGTEVVESLEKGNFDLTQGAKGEDVAALKELLNAAGYYDSAVHGVDQKANDAVRASWNAFKHDHYESPGVEVNPSNAKILVETLSGIEHPMRPEQDPSVTADISSYPSLAEVVTLKPGEVNSTAVRLSLGLLGAKGVVKQSRAMRVVQDLTDRGYIKLAQDDKGVFRLVPGGNKEPLDPETIDGSNGLFGTRDFGKREEVLNELIDSGVLERVTTTEYQSADLPEGITYQPLKAKVPDLESLAQSAEPSSESSGVVGGAKNAVQRDLNSLRHAHEFTKAVKDGTWQPPDEVKDRSLHEQFAAYMVQKEGKDWHVRASNGAGEVAGDIAASIVTSTVRPLDLPGNMLVHGASNVMKSWEQGQVYDVKNQKSVLAQSWLDIGNTTAGVLTGKVNNVKKAIAAGASAAAVSEVLQNQIDETKGGEAATNITKAVAASLILDTAPEAGAAGIKKLNEAIKLLPKNVGKVPEIPTGVTKQTNSPSASPSAVDLGEDTEIGIPESQRGTPASVAPNVDTEIFRKIKDPEVATLAKAQFEKHAPRSKEQLFIKSLVSREAFGNLDVKDQKKLLMFTGEANPNNPFFKQSRDIVHGKLVNPEFNKLSPEAQAMELKKFVDSPPPVQGKTGKILNQPINAEKLGSLKSLSVDEVKAIQLSKHPEGSIESNYIKDLTNRDAFKGLSEADQKKLLALTGGSAEEVKFQPTNRGKVYRKLSNETFNVKSTADQTQELKDFIDSPSVDLLANPSKKGFEKFVSKNTVNAIVGQGTAVKDHQFVGIVQDAIRYDVNINGETVKLYATEAVSAKDIQTVSDQLARLSPSARSEIGDVTINPVANPEDAVWQKVYNDPNFQSGATANPSTGAITIYPATTIKNLQTQQTILHELGHIVSAKQFGGAFDASNLTPGWKQWDDAVKSDATPVSKYGESNINETFSETYAIYSFIKGTPAETEYRALHPEKFKILDEIEAKYRQ